MQVRSNGTQVNVAYALPYSRASLVVLLLGCCGIAILLFSLPGFVRQIEPPCAGCYLSPFEPPLKPALRPSKLIGEPDNPPSVPHWDFSHPPVAGVAMTAPITPPRATTPSEQRDIRLTTPERDEPGIEPTDGLAWTSAFVPRWSIAAQKDLERHFLQIGTFGAITGVMAGGNPADGQSAGRSDGAASMPLNARFAIDPNPGVRDRLFGNGALIAESPTFGASFSLMGVNGFNTLDTYHANTSYRFAETIAPSIQYFHTAGLANAVEYFWPGVRPNSTGLIAEVAYAPWDKPDSPIQFLNLRLTAQYVAYREFNGTARNTGENNTLVLSLWGALHF